MFKSTRVVVFSLVMVALLVASCRSAPGIPTRAPTTVTGTAAVAGGGALLATSGPAPAAPGNAVATAGPLSQATRTNLPLLPGVAPTGQAVSTETAAQAGPTVPAAQAGATTQAATTPAPTGPAGQAVATQAPAAQAAATPAPTTQAPVAQAGVTPTSTLGSRTSFPIFGQHSPLVQPQPQAQGQPAAGQPAQSQAATPAPGQAEGQENAPAACDGHNVALEITANTTQVKVGQTVTFRVTLKNSGCSSLGKQQYQLNIGSLGTSGLEPVQPAPITNNSTLAPGQSRESTFTLRAVRAGRVAVVASSSFQVVLGDGNPPYLGVVSTTPVNITITR